MIDSESFLKSVRERADAHEEYVKAARQAVAAMLNGGGFFAPEPDRVIAMTYSLQDPAADVQNEAARGGAIATIVNLSIQRDMMTHVRRHPLELSIAVWAQRRNQVWSLSFDGRAFSPVRDAPGELLANLTNRLEQERPVG